ncbi:hypothetical protein [Burkholderia pseudomallei]|uniref:hypothetical protein n=1 Tax=Burkholderia pseudomallei TaxID=28450 RepID=UPI0013922B00|nr:hypothetical protein [Burkholderia pseudomallei]
MLMVISSSWPTMRSGSSNRRQHAPKPSNYDISTLPRRDMTTFALAPEMSIIDIMSNRRRSTAANDDRFTQAV